MIRFLTFVAVGFSASLAVAHESPIDHVDRVVLMTIHDGRLDVRYRVEVAERNVMLQLRAMDADGDGKISDVEQRDFFRKQAAELVDKLRLTLDGKPLKLTATGEATLDARLGQTFHFTAELGSPEVGRHHAQLSDYHARYAPGPYRLLQPPFSTVRETRLELTERPQLVDLERHPGLVVIDFEIVVPDAPRP